MRSVVTQVGILPSWFPTEIALIGVVALIVAVLVLNKGDWWFINVLAVDEPILVAVGLTMIAGSGWLAEMVGGPRPAWVVAGGVLAAVAVFVIRSDSYDIDFIG
jgi:hypothetical protein